MVRKFDPTQDPRPPALLVPQPPVLGPHLSVCRFTDDPTVSGRHRKTDTPRVRVKGKDIDWRSGLRSLQKIFKDGVSRSTT